MQGPLYIYVAVLAHATQASSLSSMLSDTTKQEISLGELAVGYYNYNNIMVEIIY